MIIYPAIDVRAGRVVRLRQGDFNRQTLYDQEPVALAQRYANSGAVWMHVVDLDGARDPLVRQVTLIEAMIAQADINIQIGGGVRSADDVEVLFSAGAKRVVIGSLAISDPAATQEIFQTFGAERICLAMDVRRGEHGFLVAHSGWEHTSDLTPDAFLGLYQSSGVRHVLCTDITCDGAMTGPNHSLYASLAKAFPEVAFQASGGVHALSDFDGLQTDGVIIGRALLEGVFTVEEALAVVC